MIQRINKDHMSDFSHILKGYDKTNTRTHLQIYTTFVSLSFCRSYFSGKTYRNSIDYQVPNRIVITIDGSYKTLYLRVLTHIPVETNRTNCSSGIHRIWRRVDSPSLSRHKNMNRVNLQNSTRWLRLDDWMIPPHDTVEESGVLLVSSHVPLG